MTRETRIIIALSLILLLILGLTTALTHSLGWSMLATASLIFVLTYPLVWLAWRSYQYWCQSIMQLTTYAQILREGGHNMQLNSHAPGELMYELQQEINLLAQSQHQQQQQHQSLSSLLSHIMDYWTVQCLFACLIRSLD